VKPVATLAAGFGNYFAGFATKKSMFMFPSSGPSAWICLASDLTGFGFPGFYPAVQLPPPAVVSTQREEVY
jgi:hypothetical protein